MRDFPFFIARRISLASDGMKSSPAVKVAVAAVALSVTVMLAAIAIVLGFKQQIRDKAVGFNSHLSLYAADSAEGLGNIVTLTPTLKEALYSQPYVTACDVQSVIPAILKTKQDFKGVYLKGLVGNSGINFMKSNLVQGSVPDFSKPENNLKILISNVAARQLGLAPGDKIDTYFISDDVRVRRLEVAGVYNSHFESYDDVLVFGDISLIQKLGGLNGNQGTFMLLNVDDFNRIDEYATRLQNTLDTQHNNGLLARRYSVDTVTRQSAGLFRWLDLLDVNVAVVLTLMTFVACMTLISGMLIIILDKKRFIGLLKAMGTPNRTIRRIFILLAVRIAALGMIIGNCLTLSLLYIQQKTHFIPLDPDSYYIDFVPVSISWLPILLLNVGVVAVVYIALILPSRFVASVSPAETMRYE